MYKLWKQDNIKFEKGKISAHKIQKTLVLAIFSTNFL